MARYRQSPNYIAKKSLWPAFRWWNVIFYMILIPAALIVLQLIKVDLPTLGELNDNDEVVIASPVTEKVTEGNILSSTKNEDQKNTSVTYTPTDFSKVTDSERYIVKVNSDGTFMFGLKGQDDKFISMENADPKLFLNENGTNVAWNLVPKKDAENVFYLQNSARKSYLAWDKEDNFWTTVLEEKSDCVELSVYTLNEEGVAVAISELKGGEEVIVVASAYGKALSVTATDKIGNAGVDYNVDDLTNISDTEKFVVTKNKDGSFGFVSKSEKKLAMENEDKKIAIVDNGINNRWIPEVKEGATNVFYLKNADRGCYLKYNKSNDTWQVTDDFKPAQQFEISFYDANAKVMSQLETYALFIIIALCALVILTIILLKSKVAFWILVVLLLVCVIVCLLLPPVAELFNEFVEFVLGNGWVILGLWCLFPILISLVKIIILKHKFIEFYDTYVIERTGVFFKHTKKTVFPEVTAVTTYKNILGYGDVYIDVVGPWDVTFDRMARPDDLRDYLVYHMLNNAAVENISNNPYIAATDGIF